MGYAIYAAANKQGLSRKERVATAVATIVAAEIPDIEAFTFLDQATYLTWHRAFTHSFFFAPVMALLAVGIVWLFYRSIPWKKAYPLALLAVLTHILSDLFNTWGTGIGEPFIQGRYSLGILPIVDGVILLIFALAFAIRRRIQNKVKAFRWAGIAILCYISLQGIQGTALYLKLNDTYDRVSLAADFVPSQFQVIAQKGNRFDYYHGSVYTGLEKKGTVVSQEHPAVDKALMDPTAQAIARFVPVFGAKVKEKEDSFHVTVFDPRFRLNRPSLLSTEVEVPKESLP